MDYVAIGGWIASIYADAKGTPLSEKHMMLLEEITRSSRDISEALQRIEVKVDAIFYGDIDAGVYALSNVSSSEFSVEERIEEVRRARASFEQGYARLDRLKSDYDPSKDNIARKISMEQAEIACYIALCHFILDKKGESSKWFQTAYFDLPSSSFKPSFVKKLEKINDTRGRDSLLAAGAIAASFFTAGLGLLAIMGGWSLYDTNKRVNELEELAAEWEEIEEESQRRKQEIEEHIMVCV